MEFKSKNAESRSSPRTPPWPYASNYDLHEMAGGLPFLAFTAPNIHLSSKRKREVCKPVRKLTSLDKNVGPKEHITHQAGGNYKSSCESSSYS